MKNKFLCFTVFLLLFMVSFCKAQLLDGSSYTITNWQNGKASATVFTFDDWSPGQKAIVVPTLISKELQATLFITTNDIWNNSEYTILNNAAQHGIEVANHTISHPHLNAASAINLHKEVSAPTDTLNAHVPGQKVLSFAYPYGEYNNTVIAEVKLKLLSARTVNRPVSGHWDYNFATTIDDYYKLSTVSIDPNYTVANLGTDVEAAIADGGLITFLIHSVYNNDVDDQWFNAITEQQLDDLLDKLLLYKNQTWITTVADAVRYHKERASATLTLVTDNTSAKTISLSDSLSDNSIYNVPLTLKLYKSVSETYSSIQQNGNDLTFTYSSSNDSVIFNATPDAGNIVLQKNSVLSTTSGLDAQQGFRLWPLPAKELLNIESFSLSGKAHLIIADLQGKTIKSVELESNGTNLYTTSIAEIPAGIYTIQWQQNDISRTQKLIIQR